MHLIKRVRRLNRIALFTILCTGAAAASAGGAISPTDACVTGAAAYHHVNPYVLAAILRVEGMRDDQVTRNANGTVDIGRAAINSVHLPDLARYGLTPQSLLDGCTNTYVAAWLVRRNLARYGNTWAGYAAYHSRTPEFNRRYQILIANELIRMGVLHGPIQTADARPAQ